MEEIKRVDIAFGDKMAGAGNNMTIQYDLFNIEKAFLKCNEELEEMEMAACSYDFQEEDISEMTENLRTLLTYVECAHPYASEVLDFPLYKNFKSNATESLSNIILDDLKTENTFGMEEYIEVNEYGYEYIARQVKKEIRFSDFLGLQDITAQDGYPVLENVETIGEFASLFRMDYDKIKPEDMDINTFLKEYLSYGEFEHTGYHPVKDFLSGLLDITIIIPIIDCILGEDIITGERLNDFQRGMKLAGAAVDLFTLGQAMALTGGLEAGAKVIARTIAVELLSNAASYTVGYGADAIGMPLPITWMLSVVTGCTVSATVGGYLFKNPDGTITKCSTEEAEEIIKNLDAGAEVELTGLKGDIYSVGDATFMDADDAFLSNISHRTDVNANGCYDVIAHGTPNGIQITHNGQHMIVNHKTAARLIQNSDDYNGQAIRLLSCNTGSLDNGFAQNLANKLNVEVYAPTSYLWSMPNGNYFVAGMNNSRLPNMKEIGNFKLFIPGGNL